VGQTVESVQGGRGQDTLIGDTRPNRLAGGDGQDYIDGGPGGGDRLLGEGDRDALRARNGKPDDVDCGPETDFAITDPADAVADCDTVDRGVRNEPVLGRSAVTQPVQGRLHLQLQGTNRFIPLLDRINVPFSSRIDAEEGVIELRTAQAAGSAKFRGAIFTVTQRRSRKAVTELRLRGDFSDCKRGSKRGVASLWGDGRGRFRTRGRYSTATVRRGIWLTEDRCDGTLTRFRKGKGVVLGLRRGRKVTIRAGQCPYLVTPKRSRRVC
jgi:hypothetical protein